MKTITHILQATKDSYEKLKFETYITWCQSYGKTPNRMQSLLCNQRVYDWFSNEYRKTELLFLEQVNPTWNVGEIRLLYAEITNRVLFVYPRPLVKKVQKIALQTTNYN